MKISKQQELSEFVGDIRADSEAFTSDPDIAQAFDEEQRRNGLVQRTRLLLEEQPSITISDVTAGDVDADDVDASFVGEEAVGGGNPTPGQDAVDAIGQSVGLTYQVDEPLASEAKLRRRDQHRWELDPASAEDFQERQLGL